MLNKSLTFPSVAFFVDEISFISLGISLSNLRKFFRFLRCYSLQKNSKIIKYTIMNLVPKKYGINIKMGSHTLTQLQYADVEF